MDTVDSLLAQHVVFGLASIDRIGVAGYIPGLAYEGGVIRFLLNRGYHIPSPAGLGHNHDRLVRDLERFTADHGLEVIRFGKGESKEEVARPYLAGAKREGRSGVVLVGKAQERVAAWVGFKDKADARSSEHHPHFTYRRQSRVPDSWYFYLWDPDWGPASVRLCSYAPYPVWVNCNGHEWLKCQLDRAGVGYEELDNGLRSVDDPALAQRISHSLNAGRLLRALTKWLSWIPSPLTELDAEAGFRYEFSLRQLEVSDTRVFDRPASGRAWFDAAIRDHLDVGRPDEVSLVVNRAVRTRGPRPTPGRFETRVTTKDVDPEIRIRYKSSKVKAYFKEQRALRVETTINNPDDFGVRRRLTAENWRALRSIGADTNARFLAALGEGESSVPDATTLQQVVLPSERDGLRAPGMRFGDPRVMALLAAVASFSHVVGGLTNAGLRALVRALWGVDYTSRQATYDLRRLRRKGFIERIAGTHTYAVTAYGRRVASFLTKVAARVVIPALTDLELAARPRPPTPRPVITAWRTYEREVQRIIDTARLAA